jgi:OOP family OmpA-OmpF porin
VKIGLWMSSIVCAHVLAAAAHAQPYAYRGAYAGGAVGPSTMSIENDSLAVGSATASSLSTEQKSTAFKGFGGYRFNPNFAAEAGFVYFGKFRATRTVTAPAAGTVRSDITALGAYVNAVGIAPLGEHFELFAKAGFIVTGTVADRSSTGAVVLVGDSVASHVERNLHLGVGAEVRFTPKSGMRVEYEKAFGVGDAKTIGEGDIGVVFLGLVFRF